MLRHARVKKMHQDRTWKDCVSFQELQEQAAASRAAPLDSESQETRRMIERLEGKCKKKMEREKTNTPQTRTTSTPTTLPRRQSPASRCLRSSTCGKQSCEKHWPVEIRVDNQNTNSGLDGTTLIASPVGLRRTCEDANETPCPPAKRHCGKAPVTRRLKSLESQTGAKAISPLSDITNSAPRPTTSHKEVNHEVHKFSTPKINKPDLSHSHNPNKCLLCNSVIYLAPCVSTTPYITSDLLSAHPTTLRISTLDHWNRDAFSHPQLTETVSESQAYTGVRKIVLVESKRARATKDLVQSEILTLNNEKCRERIEVWDWRVLEESMGHVGVAEERLRKWLLGATMFDEDAGKAIFVASGFGVGIMG